MRGSKPLVNRLQGTPNCFISPLLALVARRHRIELEKRLKPSFIHLAGLAFALTPAFIIGSGSSAFAQASPDPSASAAPATMATNSPATVPGASQPAAPAPAASAEAAPAAPAVAARENFLNRITINAAPLYSGSTGSDDAPAPLASRTTHIGYTTEHRNTDDIRVDYGISFKLDGRTDLSYSHGNIAYQLGRIFIGNTTELSSGDLVDYTDTIALNHNLGGGLAIHATYFNHQRPFGPSDFCLNSKSCFGQPNLQSIDEHGYTFGGGYDFGPTSKIGKVFNAAFDVKYVPRPSTPNDPANVALGGLGAYVGSQVLFPYSFTVKLPITNSSTFIPFVNYTNLPVLYRDSAVPEEYRGIVFGFAKVISKNATLSYTNLNLETCRCVARLPTDNLRLSLGIIKLDLHTGF